MSTQIFNNFPASALQDWFLAHKRSLPWRDNPSAYMVWISEVMLQQTQVAVVVPYFQRWMQLFPSIVELAKAPLEQVLKAWEGLGYYARARRLHAAAQYLIEHFEGRVPHEVEHLKTIKGLGPYTIGAIRSFAFKQKCAAVDGNVMRVLARYFCIEEDIDKTKTKQKIWNLATDIVPEKEPWIFNEALIELGATICTKRPKCEVCPLKSSCAGYRHKASERLPFKSTKTNIEHLQRAVAIIENPHKQLLVQKGEAGKVMCGLQEFPYFLVEGPPTLIQIKPQIEQLLGCQVHFAFQLKEHYHTFTRYKATLYPFYFVCQTAGLKVPACEWQSPLNLDQQAFSAGHRRIYSSWKFAVSTVQPS